MYSKFMFTSPLKKKVMMNAEEYGFYRPDEIKHKAPKLITQEGCRRGILAVASVLKYLPELCNYLFCDYLVIEVWNLCHLDEKYIQVNPCTYTHVQIVL